MSTESVDPVVNEPLVSPQRSPIERVIVWGGIGLLLVVALIEARALRGYGTSLSAVQAALANDEEVQITLDDARELMAFGPSESIRESNSAFLKHHQFSWFSLFKSGQYELTLDITADEEALVLGFSTPEAADQVVKPVSEKSPATESAAGDFGNQGSSFQGLTGGGFPGGGFSDGGGFQPRPDPLLAQLDSDTDGELSAEEIAAAGDALLALDENGDGELSEEEFDPVGLRRRLEQSPFGSGDSGGTDSDSSRPRRPPIEG